MYDHIFRMEIYAPGIKPVCRLYASICRKLKYNSLFDVLLDSYCDVWWFVES